MHAKVNIFKSRPILVGSFALLVLLTCSYHFLIRVDFNLSGLIALTALTVFLSLAKETKIFLIDSLKRPGKNFLILCILFFSFAGIMFHFANTIEIGLFAFLFFSIYLILKNQDNNLNNFIVNLMICSGVFISIGVLIGLFESTFLSSKLFYSIYTDYVYIDQKVDYSGFGYNYNSSAYIIIVAQSFLFLSTSIFLKNLRIYLTALFLLALLITGAKIAVLFIFLAICNYFIKRIKLRNLLNIILITLYLFASHIVISFHDSYELGSSHYRELLFSIGDIDFILGNYGYLKIAYFIELSNNFFFPVSLSEITRSITWDPHSLIFSLIILGGFPLALSVLAFLVKGIYKNFRIIKERYPNYYFCGLISIITETFMWDSGNSIFFWVIILYAITISKNSYPSEIIIGQPWGGLGDNLQFTTLPKLFHEAGHQVCISKFNIYRNKEIYDFCWSDNPYISSVAADQYNAGSVAMSIEKRKTDNVVSAAEIRHGFEGTGRYPEIYYEPKKLKGWSNKVLVDLSAHTLIEQGIDTWYNKDDLSHLINTRIPHKNVYFVIFKNVNFKSLSDRFDYEKNEVEVESIFHYADLIHSCKELYCLYSGVNSMAAAVKNKSGSEVKITCFLHGTKQEEIDKSHFIFDNVNYIEVYSWGG